MAVRWLSDVRADDVGIVGGKGASLGELTDAGLPVPPGFVVTAETYRSFIENAGIDQELFETVDIDHEDSEALGEAADRAEELILETPLPESVREEILEAYRSIGDEDEEAFVAVRSSATAEDLPSIAADEHALVRVDGEPVFGRMAEIAPIDCGRHDVEVPSLTADGVAWREVERLYEHPPKESHLYRITTSSGREITVTPDHSLLVLDENALEPKTATIDELDGDEKVPVARELPPMEAGSDTIDVTEYVNGGIIRSDGGLTIDTNPTNASIQNSLPERIQADEEFAYFLGLYVAEGSTYDRNQVLITDTEEPVLQRAVGVMDRLGLCNGQEQNNESCRFYCKSLVTFLHAVAGEPGESHRKGRAATHKRVPEFVFGWDRNRIGQFLRGCFDGGGTVGDEIRYATTSEELFEGLTRLLELVGIDYRIEERTHEHGCDSYRLSVPAREAAAFRDRVGFESRKKSRRLEELFNDHLDELDELDVNSVRFDETVAWEDIEEIEQVAYDGPVYDFCVPEAENFAAGRGSVVTHNTASFAGQQETFLNVREEKLLEKVKACWASLFTQRAIYYRNRQGFDHADVDIAVVVQEMVDADKSGVMFTSHPSTGEPEIVIEAAWGLGEAVVSGTVSPDNYVVDRETAAIEQSTIATKRTKMIKHPETGESTTVDVSEDKRDVQVLDDAEIERLVELGVRVEEHYDTPQDVEWAIVDGTVYMLQSRPITTLGETGDVEDASPDDRDRTADAPGTIGNGVSTNDRTATDGNGEGDADGETAGDTNGDGETLLSGLGASPGVVSGTARIVTKLDHLDQVSEGDVIVTEMTMPDMVPAMKRAVGIVTDEGGMTSHASIVSRELGVPAVVGTTRATRVLSDGQVVTIDGEKGTVVAGDQTEPEDADRPEETEEYDPVEAVRPETPVKPMTATEVKVNVSIPEAAERAAATGADGVGLLRIEHMALSLGQTPERYIEENGESAYRDRIVEGIREVANEFYPRPVRARTMDAPTDEFRDLEGGENEPDEHNPMLGYRGIRRSLDKPAVFQQELAAFRQLYEVGYDNVELMFPLVNDAEDIYRAKEHMREAGIDPEKRRWGVMIETPASALEIESIAEAGIDFASFGTNDLTQYTLAIDRNNEHVADGFDELHPAVLELMARTIETCRELGVDTSICGQAASKPEMVRFLVKQGISSLSANIDAVRDVQHEAKRVEQRLLLDSVR